MKGRNRMEDVDVRAILECGSVGQKISLEYMYFRFCIFNSNNSNSDLIVLHGYRCN